jgi:DNA polymerase I-like protein with 3'-5' exonuclease and polymerase domains
MSEGITYAIYDVETTARSDVGFAANPFDVENELLLGGYKLPSGVVVQTEKASCWSVAARLIVGANLSFDLSWAARKLGTTPAYLMRGRRIWDVCLAEYILQRQRVRMPSLDKCAELRGLEIRKDSSVSESIKSGVCPSSIPMPVLKEYHAQDLEVTHQVFLAQFAEAKERGMLPLIWSQMEALVATTEMQYNGILVDTVALQEYRDKLIAKTKHLEGAFTETLSFASKDHVGVREFLHHNGHLAADEVLNSNKQLSLLFFGGEIAVKETHVVGTYKNGKPKTKILEVKYPITGTYLPGPHGAKATKLGYYTVDDAVLKSIAMQPDSAALAASIVREYREAHKQLSTYVDGTTKHLHKDNRVHCSFNHNVTLTGRLSCSSPNLQNQSDGEIKRCYIPTDGYVFVEFDYSQLEVVGLAILSKDKQLLHDIETGTDIHTALYEDMYKRTPTTAERKAFKPLTFGLIYGAGANTMAENSGISRAEAARFMATFYSRYPQVEVYHKNLQAEAKVRRIPTADKTPLGLPRGKYVHRMPTGREYEFYEYDPVGPWSTKGSFSPTELKNWPIQGWSTGDVVPLMVGYVVREITNSKWYRLIRPVVTVHDSIMFEVRQDVLEEARNYLVELMSKTRQVYADQFGQDIGIDLKTEHKTGLNWKEMYA